MKNTKGNFEILLVCCGAGSIVFASKRPFTDQTVTVKGAYDTGTYRVIFRRAFKVNVSNVKAGSSNAKMSTLDFVPGQTVRVVFAVWNGHAGDRDGKKSVTIWQDLVIAK